MIQTLINGIQAKLKYYQERLAARRVVSLSPKSKPKGNVLLSYINSPCLRPHQPISNSHTNYWESAQIVQTFLELGYAVDVIHHHNRSFIPQKNYDVLIDSRQNMQRLAPIVGSNCIKIFHIDITNTLFNSAAELNRLVALQQRRGITLPPRRFEYPNLGIEHADCATILGNEATSQTFKFANKPMYRIPISTTATFPWLEDKDFESCRKNFVWFGSYALVHKGLDLVLEAFAQMPDCHLTICGPIHKEEDFVKAFHKELYETPNIHTIGWVDVESQEFLEIINNSVATIYATCSEGGGGCVITAMHAGLIPIVSYESSVDVSDDYGIILEDSSIEAIKAAVRSVTEFSAQDLKQMAHNAWVFARANHTRENFAKVYRETAELILAKHKSVSQVPGNSVDLDSSDEMTVEVVV
jgi:glycosyltransferase involved in cell wall biosynthesis